MAQKSHAVGSSSELPQSSLPFCSLSAVTSCAAHCCSFFRKHGEQQFTFCMCRMCSMCGLLVSASKEHLQTKMIDFYNEKLVHTEQMFRKYCTKNCWQNHYNSKDCIVKKPADLGTIDEKQWPRMRRAGSTGVEEGEGAYGNFSLSAVGCILTQGLRM